MSMQDDLLWYRLKKNKHRPAQLPPRRPDGQSRRAQRHARARRARALVWDDGFGSGWGPNYSYSEIWGLKHHQAEKLLYGIVRKTTRRYRGQIAVLDRRQRGHRPRQRHQARQRTDVPLVSHHRPRLRARVVPHRPRGRPARGAHHQRVRTRDHQPVRRHGSTRGSGALLQFIDKIMHHTCPLGGVGIEAHLLAPHFKERFHTRHFLKFLKEIADRGLNIHITEMDVTDDGLPPNPTHPRPRCRRRLPAVPGHRSAGAGRQDRQHVRPVRPVHTADPGLPAQPTGCRGERCPSTARWSPSPPTTPSATRLQDAPYRRPAFTPPRAR